MKFSSALAVLTVVLLIVSFSLSASPALAQSEEELFNQAMELVYDDPLRAEALFHRVIEINPSNLQAQQNMAMLMVGAERFAEAIPSFRKLVESSPNDPVIWYNLGQCLYATQDHQAALLCFEKVVSLEPNDPENWIELARTALELGKTARAEEAYLKVLKLSPNDIRGHMGLATVAIEKNDRTLFERKLGTVMAINQEAARLLKKLWDESANKESADSEKK